MECGALVYPYRGDEKFCSRCGAALKWGEREIGEFTQKIYGCPKYGDKYVHDFWWESLDGIVEKVMKENASRIPK